MSYCLYVCEVHKGVFTYSSVSTCSCTFALPRPYEAAAVQGFSQRLNVLTSVLIGQGGGLRRARKSDTSLISSIFFPPSLPLCFSPSGINALPHGEETGEETEERSERSTERTRLSLSKVLPDLYTFMWLEKGREERGGERGS